MELASTIADRIAYRGAEQMTVEKIQDNVEIELMKSRRKMWHNYISLIETSGVLHVRQKREIFSGNYRNEIQRHYPRKRKYECGHPGRNDDEISSETTKPFVDDYLLTEEVKTAIRQGYLHIHDKDYYPTKSLTCVQHPLDKILKNGFFAGHGESRPAKRIETASILGCISGNRPKRNARGQAIPAFDFIWLPYVRSSFAEEVKVLEELNGENYNNLYHIKIKTIFHGNYQV